MGNSAQKRAPVWACWPGWPWAGSAMRPLRRLMRRDEARRRLGMEPLEPRAMLASDLTSGGLAASATAPVEETATLPTMEVRVDIAKLDGSPASTLQLGEPFWVTVSTRDLRAEPQGVFAVYVDVRWDADRAVVVGPAEFLGPFTNAPNGTPAAGALDELGAFAGLDPTREGLYQVVRVPMQAVTPGELNFALDPADLLPMHALLMYGRDDLIDPAEVRMVGASVVIEGGPQTPTSGPPATDPALGPPSSADEENLLLLGTLDAAGPLRGTWDTSASGGQQGSDDRDTGALPASDLLVLDPDSDPSRRQTGPTTLTAGTSDTSDETLAEDQRTDEGGAAELGSPLPGLP